MKLDYKILWIEDDYSWRISITSAIKKHIKDKGFNPIIETPSKDELSNISNEAFKDFDLLLVDHDLKSMSKDNGDILIQKIRNHKIFTNIVFYSSNIERLDEEAKDKKLSGVYIFERRQLDLDKIEDLYELIDFFLERDMDTNSLRGIAMSEVAEFDAKIWDIIKFNEDNIKTILAEAVKQCRFKKYDELKSKTEEKIWELVDNKGTAILDSFHMHKFLCDEILKKEGYVCSLEAETCINHYHTDILKKRNELAHSREAMTKDEQINFRKKLIEFREIFKKLKDELCKEQ